MSARLQRTGPAPKPGIVHLGPGAFFRAFVATFTHDAMAAKGGDWGIVAISLQSPTARDQLSPQGGVFMARTLSPEGTQDRVIGSICDVLVAPEDPRAVLSALSDPAIKIVTLTLTEKGYCHAPATGDLDLDHPGIAHDLTAAHPRTAPGFLTAALAARRAAGTPPFAVMSCDNLPDNGALTRRIVLGFARAKDSDLADWIADHVAFPATMVDRITPATTPGDVADLAAATGVDDPAMVQHEPFAQWVFQDSFPQGRPAWDMVGAQGVADVAAHEAMKLRCLNGTHSTLAYLGFLAGHETITEAVADPPFAALCTHLWDHEITPTLVPPEGEDLRAYTAALMERYKNPAIRHRTWQIAMDGSQKLPQRILGTLADNLRAGRPCPGLFLAVAGWMRYVGGVDESGAPIEVKDPLAATLKTAWDSAETPEDKVRALLAERRVFGAELAGDPAIQAGLISAYTAVAERGARRAVSELLSRVEAIK